MLGDMSRRDFLKRSLIAGAAAGAAAVPVFGKAPKEKTPAEMEVDEIAERFDRRLSFGIEVVGPEEYADFEQQRGLIQQILRSGNKDWGMSVGGDASRQPWLNATGQQVFKNQYGASHDHPWITHEMAELLGEYQGWADRNAVLIPDYHEVSAKRFDTEFPIRSEITPLVTGYTLNGKDNKQEVFEHLKELELFLRTGRKTMIQGNDALASTIHIDDVLVGGKSGAYDAPVFVLTESLYRELEAELGKKDPDLRALEPGTYRHDSHVQTPEVVTGNQLNARIFYVLNDLGKKNPAYSPVSEEHFFSKPTDKIDTTVLNRYNEIFNPDGGSDGYSRAIQALVDAGSVQPAAEPTKERGNKRIRLMTGDYNGDNIVTDSDLAFFGDKDKTRTWRERLTEGNLDTAITQKEVASNQPYLAFLGRKQEQKYLN